MSAAIPLTWVRNAGGGTSVVNVGDALSPLIVAMVSGQRVAPAPFRSRGRRLAAIGTIAQKFEGGEVLVWGTGCDPRPRGPDGEPRAYARPAATRFDIRATRGPRTAALLGADRPIPFGDPAELLPLFYSPKIEPKWELGVILHLSELSERGLEVKPRDGLHRYLIPEELKNDIKPITMISDASLGGVRAKIDEILSCRRILSTSLHGVSLAMAYGVPCAYFGAGYGPAGAVEIPLDGEEEGVNTRFLDLFAGYGAKRLAFVRQPKPDRSNWPALIDAVDTVAERHRIDADALIEAFPGGADPLTPPQGATIWDHPALASVPLGAKSGLFSRIAASLSPSKTP